MYYDIHREAGDYRYLIQHGGRNVITAFQAGDTEGKYLDQVLDADRFAFSRLAFVTCIEARRPVYTISAVWDVNGIPVSYERLALPFGANDRVQQLIVSLKSISIEGRFEPKGLMRPDGQRYSYELCAVIDRDLDGAQSRLVTSDDVVEI